MDETWIHHFTLESNRQSAEWTVAGESCPKRLKTQTSADKGCMCKVFCSLITLRKEEPSIANLYSIIGAFEGRNHQKMATNEEEKLLFHQNNAPCHKSITTMAKLHELHFELLPHPHYSPDLAPTNYFLFADLKRMLQGKRFGSNEEVILVTELRQIVLQKMHQIIREALESVYHPGRRL